MGKGDSHGESKRGAIVMKFETLLNKKFFQKGFFCDELAIKRLEEEISYFKSVNYCSFLLEAHRFIKDIVGTRKHAIYPRGAEAGSLVLYLLDLSDVNPLSYNLSFDIFREELESHNFNIGFSYIGIDAIEKEIDGHRLSLLPNNYARAMYRYHGLFDRNDNEICHDECFLRLTDDQLINIVDSRTKSLMLNGVSSFFDLVKIQGIVIGVNVEEANLMNEEFIYSRDMFVEKLQHYLPLNESLKVARLCMDERTKHEGLEILKKKRVDSGLFYFAEHIGYLPSKSHLIIEARQIVKLLWAKNWFPGLSKFIYVYKRDEVLSMLSDEDIYKLCKLYLKGKLSITQIQKTFNCGFRKAGLIYLFLREDQFVETKKEQVIVS